MLKVRCLAIDLWEYKCQDTSGETIEPFKHRFLYVDTPFTLGAQWSHWKIASVLGTRPLQ